MAWTFTTPNLELHTVQATACQDLYLFAREYALTATSPVPALRLDAAAQIAVEHGADLPDPAPGEPASVAAVRRHARGTETVGEEYTLPVTLEEATVAIVDLADRHAQAHPGYTADAVRAHLLRLDHAVLVDRRPADRRG